MRTELLNLLAENFADSINEEIGNVLVDDETLIVYFGELYASNPTESQFQLGDRILIKELVNFVKNIVDAKGMNSSGLRYFQVKENKNKQKSVSTASKNVRKDIIQEKQTNSTTTDQFDIPTLQIELRKKIDARLRSHGVDLPADNDASDSDL